MTVTPYPKFKEGGLREGATVSCSVKILWRSYSIDFKTLRHPGLEFGLMYWLLCISKCPHTRTAWKQRLTFWIKTSKVSLGLSGMIQKGRLPPKHRPLGTIRSQNKNRKDKFLDTDKRLCEKNNMEQCLSLYWPYHYSLNRRNLCTFLLWRVYNRLMCLRQISHIFSVTFK